MAGRCAVALVLLALGAPPGAQAHVRSGVVAVSYRATVVTRPPAISPTVDRSDLALRIGVPARHAVVVGGYLGEPFARIDARGVAVNAASPTAAATGLAKRGHGWRRVSRARNLTWHDARVRGLRAGVDHGNWAVPVTVDGRRARLTGLIDRVPAPPWWPWVVLAVPFAIATVLVLLDARPRAHERGAAALGAAAAAATLIGALAFALDRYASAGTLVESVNEVVLALAGLGALAFVRGPAAARFGVAAGLGTLGLFIGLTKFAALTHGVVLAVLPAAVVRAVVVVALAAGAGAVTVATRFFLSAEIQPRI